MDNEPAETQFLKDRFIPGARPDSAEIADKRDRFTAEAESDEVHDYHRQKLRQQVALGLRQRPGKQVALGLWQRPWKLTG